MHSSYASKHVLALASIILLAACSTAFLPRIVSAGGNADCQDGDYSCDYPAKKQPNINSSATVQCMRNKPCNSSAQGAIIQGKCKAANSCDAEKAQDANKKDQDVKDSGAKDSQTAANKAVQDLLKNPDGTPNMNQQQMMAEMAKQQAGVTAQPESVVKNPGYSPTSDPYNPEHWGSDSSLGKAYDKQFVNDANYNSMLSRIGVTPAEAQASFDQIVNDLTPNAQTVDEYIRTDDLSNYGLNGLGANMAFTMYIAPALSPLPTWGSPGWGGSYTPGASYPSTGSYGSGGYYTPSAPVASPPQMTGFGNPQVVQGAFTNSNCASGVCMALGQSGSAVIQPANVANRIGMSPVEQAMADAKAQQGGTVGDYLKQGFDSAAKSVMAAGQGLQDGISQALGLEPNPGMDTIGESGPVTGNTDAVQLPDVEVVQPVVTDPGSDLSPRTGADVPDSLVPRLEDGGAYEPPQIQAIPPATYSDAPQVSGVPTRGGAGASDGGNLTQLGGTKTSPFGLGIEVVGGEGLPAGADVGAVHSDPFVGFREGANANASAYVFPDSVFSTAKAAPASVSVTGDTAPSTGSAPAAVPVGPSGPSGPSGPASPASGPGTPAQGGQGGGGMEGIGQMLQSLMGMLKGGGGGGSGSGSGQSMPPVTAASNSVLQTPVPSTQFATAKPLTLAPTVSVVANPDSIASGAQSVVSWSAVWNDASSTPGECAVIDATGATLVASAGANSSYQTNALSRSAYYIVGCKQQGGKLGSGVVLVTVQGDTQGPVPLPKALTDYQSTTGLSSPGADLAQAVGGSAAPATQTQDQQKMEVACDPNSQGYIDCLTSKMQFVDKLYE